MNNIDLVKTSLEYYDKNNEIYNNILKHAKYIKFIEAKNDMENNVIIFFDKNKKKLFESRYEIIGLYNSNSNTWTWSWAISTFKKNNTSIARKLWNYGVMLDPNILYLKTELITSRFRIADFIQLDIHASIASYISKNPFVYKYKFGNMSEKSINTNTIDSEGLITIDENANNVLVYYMFMLDFEVIKNESENNCSDNIN
jgi:hypothetical protein